MSSRDVNGTKAPVQQTTNFVNRSWRKTVVISCLSEVTGTHTMYGASDLTVICIRPSTVTLVIAADHSTYEAIGSGTASSTLLLL